jgi:glycogen debranching enzyme
MHRVQLRARANQHFVYSGSSVLVTNLGGMVAGRGSEGFYVENTRMLSRLALCTARGEPRAVAVSPAGGDRLLAYLQLAGDDEAFITLDAVVGERLDMRLKLENYSLRGEGTSVELGIELDADFADAQEVEDGRRRQHGDVEKRWDEGQGLLTFRYSNPKVHRATLVRVVSSPAASWDGHTLTVRIDIPSHGATEVKLEVTPEGVPRQPPMQAARARLKSTIPKLMTSNDDVARAWKTATEDLATMPLGNAAGPLAPIAGIPLYQQFFGRDVLTTGWQALMAMPSMMRDALKANAAMQGRVIDDWRDEEPGKLIHQATQGPLAEAGITNNMRNYGDYATAPDFLIMLGQYLLWTNDTSTVRDLLPTARRVIEWIERYGDRDGDGLIEYETRSPVGIRNQGWKDADDAIVDADGRVVEPPIATVELQAYVYAGLQQAAIAFALAGKDRGYAVELMGKARAMRKRINARFWMPEQGFYAMALDADKRQVASISSNPAHLLASGVVPRSRAGMVAGRLMQPDMFSGWGIRTLSDDHPAYNPFSYHRGSVWPVENGTAALGLARYGCWAELHRLTEGLFALSSCFDEGRLAESVGGMPRDAAHPHPGIYPESCQPQAWSASMIVQLVQSLVGMLPLAPLGLVCVDPHLPPWLPDLRLRGVGVGDAKVDLDIWRTAGGRTRYSYRTRGKVRVVRVGTRAWNAASLLI